MPLFTGLLLCLLWSIVDGIRTDLRETREWRAKGLHPMTREERHALLTRDDPEAAAEGIARAVKRWPRGIAARMGARRRRWL